MDSSEAIQRVLNGERPAHKRRGGGKKEGGTEGGREGREEGEKPRGKERPPEAKGHSRGDRPKEGRDREGKRQERERKRDDTQEQRVSEFAQFYGFVFIGWFPGGKSWRREGERKRGGKTEWAEGRQRKGGGHRGVRDQSSREARDGERRRRGSGE